MAESPTCSADDGRLAYWAFSKACTSRYMLVLVGDWVEMKLWVLYIPYKMPRTQ